MSDYHDHALDERLEKYLDHLLQGDELAEFEERLRHDPDTQRAVEQHRVFEARLRACLAPASVSASEVSRWISTPVDRGSRYKRNAKYTAVAVLSVVAAVVSWMVVVTQWNGSRRNIEPFFEQRPLAVLYRETVDQGFRPYYYCDDEERFAQTFRKRQDAPLALRSHPDDRRMVGLSYIGGLSRDTTAMLAYADQQPVVVFVDRKEFDNEELATRCPEGLEELQVHRSEVGELVIYEVSPFIGAKMSPYLAIDE